MKKFVPYILGLALAVCMVCTAFAYISLSLDCADIDEYQYSDAAFYYADMNVVLDYDADRDMYYFYDTDFAQRVYLPDFVKE